MSLDDWLLALHVLAGAVYGAGVVLFWVLLVAARRTDTPEGMLRLRPVTGVGNVAVISGAVGTIVLGIWLALSVGDYDLWDGWIIAAIVLWAIASGVGELGGREYLRGMTKAEELQAAGQSGPSAELLALNRSQRGVVLQAVASVVFVLIVVDMIWKPGA